VDADAIGTFSGGNPRVGLALAHTLRSGESLSGLSDDELFKRLFHQRHYEDAGLLACAEACALVYSFEGELFEGDEAELPRLAALAGCPITVLHRHVAELARRGLLQRRSQWRAILPHAIANRLAKRALENIHPLQIHKQLVLAPERLMQSLSRRLGYLHDSEFAVRIVQDWLSESGFLGARMGNLDRLKMAILVNIAPVAPEHLLSAIERVQIENPVTFFTASNPHRAEFVRLLRKIAYDPVFFERSARLLVQFALSDTHIKDDGDGTLKAWRSLFSPFFSGTHASVTQRLRVVETLLWADDDIKQRLGIEALNASLETFHFMSAHDFGFGSRSRDYGYEPTTRTEQAAWFSACIRTLRKIGTSASVSAPKVRETFAQQLVGLWAHTSIQDEIEETVYEFSGGGFWEDGWIAVREAQWRCQRQPTDQLQIRLQILEAKLAPKTLEDDIRVHALRNRAWFIDSEDASNDTASALKRADDRAEELGCRLVKDLELFDRLLPAIMTGGNGRRLQFGRGLACAATHRPALWQRMADAVANAGEDANPSALVGYLWAWKELDLDSCQAALECAANDIRLIAWLPQFETVVGFVGSSADRLHRALNAGAPVSAFSMLAYARLTDAICMVELSNLLSAIAMVPNGWAVAVHVLATQLRANESSQIEFDLLLECGRKLLIESNLSVQTRNHLDHDLETLATKCLAGPAGQPVAAAICQSLAQAFGRNAISTYELYMFVKAVFRVQPQEALNAFLQSPPEYSWRYPTILSMFEVPAHYHGHPISQIEDDVIANWCAENPSRNFVAAATSIIYSTTSGNGPGLAWTELALRLLQNAPDPLDVLRAFAARFSPHSWSGSRAAIIEANAQLLLLQEESVNTNLARLARQERKRLLSEAREERRRETEQSRHRDERFE